MTRPFFSVVIPTFNRAHLLPLAVRSVLAQSFGDFEIVISNGGSTDDTGNVVRSFDDPRIRYIESSHRMPVGDNYQQGLDHASGEYITFLSDDDAYTPRLLEKAKDLFEKYQSKIVGYQYCRYYHDDLRDFDRPIPANSLLISDYDRSVTRFTASEAISQVYSQHGLSSARIDPRFICPYLSNAAYHRSVFDNLKRVSAKLFDTVPPDIYLAVAVFYEAEDYYCLDEPLLVWSNWAGNATVSSQRRTNSFREHYERLLNGRELEFTPLKFALPQNCGVNAILTAAHDFRRDDQPVDWSRYFCTAYENFVYLKSTGVDTEEEEREFEAVLNAQPEAVRNEVRRWIGRPAFRMKSLINSRFPSLAAGLRGIIGSASTTNFHIIEGKDAGFSDVFEAAQYFR